MPRDAVSRTANVERTGRHKWVNHKVIQQHLMFLVLLTLGMLNNLACIRIYTTNIKNQTQKLTISCLGRLLKNTEKNGKFIS